MSAEEDEGPVYYREIQKNAYLKRIPNEISNNKLLPLGHKKPAPKAMWTQLCIHNGRTPYLEQYTAAAERAAHRPAWRANLLGARHVTAGLLPHNGGHAFLVDTDAGPVRLLAPDRETMQDWVTTLRNKLHELKIVGSGENVYCGAPAAAASRAPARDPTSPLPPTPPVPVDRVPGIELTPTSRLTQQAQLEAAESNPIQQTNPSPPQTNLNQSQTTPEQPQTTPDQTETTPDQSEMNPDQQMNQDQLEPQSAAIESIQSQNIDISNWEPDSYPSTSTDTKIEPKKSVAKICGQNICLDDSILKRNVESTESDEEFFAEIDRLHASIENIDYDECLHKQRVVVNDGKDCGEGTQISDCPINITVIQVSNKSPHTAIPVLGSKDETKFDFKQNVPVTDGETDFINIVNTEVNVNDNGHNYGTVFSHENDYGHISLTTTVSLGDDRVTDGGIYERLCLASTSNDNASPLPLRKLKCNERVRKLSLPKDSTTDSAYEYLYPNNKNTTVTLNAEHHSLVEINSTNTGYINSDRNTSVNNSARSDLSTSNSETRVHNSNSVNNRALNTVNLTSSVSIGNVDLSENVIRANVERSRSQNAYDREPRREGARRTENSIPKRDKNERQENGQPKPLWKRGLTELSLLSRLRARVPGKKTDTPTQDNIDRSPLPAKVAQRCRPEQRGASARRRSASLSNGVPQPAGVVPAGAGPGVGVTSPGALVPLVVRQAAALRAALASGAAVPASAPKARPPLFIDYDRAVWIAWWGGGGAGRSGDRVAAVRAVAPSSAGHARQLFQGTAPTPAHQSPHARHVDILFHRVPLAKIFVINKRDMEPIGIKLDNECNVTHVEANSPAARTGVPPPGRWAVTEVNNRPINLIKGGEEEMNRISIHGTEVSILLQPSPFVKKMRQAIKASKPLLSIR